MKPNVFRTFSETLRTADGTTLLSPDAAIINYHIKSLRMSKGNLIPERNVRDISSINILCGRNSRTETSPACVFGDRLRRSDECAFGCGRVSLSDPSTLSEGPASAIFGPLSSNIHARLRINSIARTVFSRPKARSSIAQHRDPGPRTPKSAESGPAPNQAPNPDFSITSALIKCSDRSRW